MADIVVDSMMDTPAREITRCVKAGLAWSRGERPVLAFDRLVSAAVPVVTTDVATRVQLFGYLAPGW